MNGADATLTATVKILRRQREKRRHTLAEFADDGTQRLISLHRPEAIVGSAEDSQIHLAGKNASPHHAIIRLRDTDCIITDNESGTGIILNGVKVHSAVLRDGDVVQISDAVFVYHED